MRGHLFFDYLPASWHGKNSVVGFDVADNSIKFVKLARMEDGTVRVADFGRVDFSKDEDDADLVKKLAAIKKKYGFGNVSVALPAEGAFSMKMRLPKMAESDLRAAVGHHLAEEMFCLPSEISYDYEVLAGQLPRGFIDLNASAAPLRIVEKHVSTFRRAGLVPVSFSARNDLFRDVMVKRGDGRAYMIVDVGSRAAMISVVAAGSVWFSVTHKTRAIIEGGRFEELGSATRAMKDAVIIYRGNLEDDEDKPLFAPSAPAITHILVCGSRATEPGLVEHLAHAVGIPAALANPWQNTINFDEYIPSISRSESLECAAAIGAAAAGIEHK